MKITVAGTGYVGLSLAVLLSQNNEVTAVDVIEEKVQKLNNLISPIQDKYIEKYLFEAKEGFRNSRLLYVLCDSSLFCNETDNKENALAVSDCFLL